MVGTFTVPASGRLDEGFPCSVYRLGDAWTALTCIYCNTGQVYMSWNAYFNRIKTPHGLLCLRHWWMPLRISLSSLQTSAFIDVPKSCGLIPLSYVTL